MVSLMIVVVVVLLSVIPSDVIYFLVWFFIVFCAGFCFWYEQHSLVLADMDLSTDFLWYGTDTSWYCMLVFFWYFWSLWTNKNSALVVLLVLEGLWIYENIYELGIEQILLRVEMNVYEYDLEISKIWYRATQLGWCPVLVLVWVILVLVHGSSVEMLSCAGINTGMVCLWVYDERLEWPLWYHEYFQRIIGICEKYKRVWYIASYLYTLLD
jgi:hypothetical protein